MDWTHLSGIINGSLIGIGFVVCLIKISNIKNAFMDFREYRFQRLYNDVSRLQEEKFNYVTKELLIRHIEFLEKKILVIETKMSEREKFESQMYGCVYSNKKNI